MVANLLLSYYAICDMLYKLCLSSTFRDSTCHMEGVTIFKVYLNLCVPIYRYTLIIVTPSMWHVESRNVDERHNLYNMSQIA